MKKKSRYLWRNAFPTQEEYEKEKSRFSQMGFRIVTFIQGETGLNPHEGMKALLKNHISDTECK